VRNRERGGNRVKYRRSVLREERRGRHRSSRHAHRPSACSDTTPRVPTRRKNCPCATCRRLDLSQDGSGGEEGGAQPQTTRGWVCKKREVSEARTFFSRRPKSGSSLRSNEKNRIRTHTRTAVFQVGYCILKAVLTFRLLCCLFSQQKAIRQPRCKLKYSCRSIISCLLAARTQWPMLHPRREIRGGKEKKRQKKRE